MRDFSEEAVIGQIIESLTDTYADLPPSEVEHVVRAALTRFTDSPVREFVPLFVERRARTELSRRTSALVFST
ncbi:hypothetical protein JDV09_12020 [Mycobacterium sp. Y57]|uniref:three-helix bundle dimerization domain-containing protein n=1 Tax=Mycolicibacterium xanthum TaxID=2796469 RepID=UPI001C864D49|nr:hypothetical protein [Mycolicibacterium xanthum]MBX7432827.1 hypothetical protein [Mycolicibacterium xanthum]